MDFFRTKKFKDLQNKWYQKLKDTGFEEIEDISSPNEFLKNWDSLRFCKKSSNCNQTKVLATQHYYTLAEHFLLSYEFSILDLIGITNKKKIWHLHSQGFSIRDIAKELNLKVWQVFEAINKLSAEMLKKR